MYTQTVKKIGFTPLKNSGVFKEIRSIRSVIHFIQDSLTFQLDMDNLLPQIIKYFHVSNSRVFEAYGSISEM